MKEDSQTSQNLGTSSDDDDDDDDSCTGDDYSQGIQPSGDDTENAHADPKWTAYLLEEIEEPKPRMHITERIKLMEEEEKRRYEEAYSRGLPSLPDNFVPVTIKKPTKEEKEARYNAWKEKIARIQKEKERIMEENRKEECRRYEMYAKIQKESRTRDYYWKPDPLYTLHLRDLGYSKIAIDKALFYVDNKSVKAALRYLKENPNPTELTKEEVMAVGEEVLKKIRPIKPPNFEPFPENFESEDEMETEQESQGLQYEENRHLNLDLKILESSSSMDNSEVIEENTMKRGVKRDYHGEEVNVIEQSVQNKKTAESVSVEQQPQYQMILISNTHLLMDAVTLSLEVCKVAVKIMDKLVHGGDEFRKMQIEWMKEGSTMNMYKGIDNSHLHMLHKEAESNGYISYLAEYSQQCSDKAASPTVLGIFGERNQIGGMSSSLKKF